MPSGSVANSRERAIQVYDLLRTTRLNVLYYESSLRWRNIWIRSHDVLVALAGVSSPIAFLKHSQEPIRSQSWFYLTLVAGIAGVLKPILRLDKQVALYAELTTHYRELFSELKCIADDISSARDYSFAFEKRFLACRSKEGDLQKKEPPPSRRKIARLQALVEKQYDMAAIWLPKEDYEREEG